MDGLETGPEEAIPFSSEARLRMKKVGKRPRRSHSILKRMPLETGRACNRPEEAIPFWWRGGGVEGWDNSIFK